MKITLLGCFVLFTCAVSVAACEYSASPSETLFSNTIRNANAPAQLETFEFLVGEHTCDDVLTSQDGTVTHLRGHWSGRYILNGNAIQDHYWNEQYAATNIRVYDPTEARWQVTYFRYPDYRSGTWEGDKAGDKIILKRSFQYLSQTLVSELVFENISQQGFYWHSSYVSDSAKLVNWTSTCLRSETSG